MKNLKFALIVTLGSLFFASCTTKYGCPYNTFQETEIQSEKAERTLPVPRTSTVVETVAVAR